MRLTERFRRWRATRGYGVHSPLAYRLVTDAMRPPRDVAFYGEERLEEFADAKGLPRRELRRARLLLRLTAALQPSYVWVAPGVPELLREAVRLAGCAVRLYDGKTFPAELPHCDMAVTVANRLKRDRLGEFLRPGKALVGFDVPAVFTRDAEKAMTGGVVLDGAGSIVVVCTADAALHKYNISPF